MFSKAYSSSLWDNLTVGLLGGSFNPAHDGHRHASLEAMKRLGLDAVWWMVSPQNPLKSTAGMSSLPVRLKSAKAVARHPRIFVTDIERKIGTRYTVETLRKLRQIHPRTRFVWLMGMDNLMQIHLWKHWEEIFHTVPICVVDRAVKGGGMRTCKAWERFRHRLIPSDRAGGILTSSPLPAWAILHGSLHPLSSTQIRAQKKARHL